MHTLKRKFTGFNQHLNINWKFRLDKEHIVHDDSNYNLEERRFKYSFHLNVAIQVFG